MSGWATALEATSFATALRQSIWVYPLVNAGHILGVALLVGTVAAMDIRILHRGNPGSRADLRSLSLAGFGLAALCGALLFAVQASDYLKSPWFLVKAALIAAAALNALLFHLAGQRKTPRVFAAASLVFWVAVLICGRMIGYR